MKYKFDKPMKCAKVDCDVKSQSDNGCENEAEKCNPRSKAVSGEEEGDRGLVSNDIEEDE